jgi:hypothetical protein
MQKMLWRWDASPVSFERVLLCALAFTSGAPTTCYLLYTEPSDVVMYSHYPDTTTCVCPAIESPLRRDKPR